MLDSSVGDPPTAHDRPIGGTLTLYIEVSSVDDLFERVKAHAPIVMPMKTQFYGMKEFAIADPDGYILTLAQRVAAGH